MQTHFDIGSISEGTLKTEDIGNNLIWHLDRIDLDTNDLNTFNKLKKEFSAEIENLEESDNKYQDVNVISGVDLSEKLEYIFDEIKEIAENYTPDYCYLGMSGCDGADFGVWPVSELFEDTRQGSYDGMVYRSTVHTNGVDEPVPDEYSHYLAVNDHGNCTLWSRNGETWTECWAVV
jgi:hypothetical protein